MSNIKWLKMFKRLKENTNSQSFFGQVFELMGPVLAGFQVAAAIVSFFGVGAFANWIIENWFPFTRAVWTIILRYVTLPDITVAEKDALTTVVFFLPLAIYAVYSRFSGQSSGADKFFTGAAFVVGSVFLFVLGEQVFSDIGEIVRSLSSLDGVTFLGVVIYALIALYLVFVAGFSWTFLRRVHAKLFRRLSDHEIEQQFSLYHYSLKATAIPMIIVTFLVVSLCVLFYDAIGVIRVVSIISTLSLLLVAVVFAPRRILVTLGVVVLFVVSSITWELAVLILKTIENVASNT